MPCRVVLCRVHISVVEITTSDTLENCLALAVPSSDYLAFRATLARVRGRDVPHTLLILVFQTLGEHAPALVQNRTVQPSLRRYLGHQITWYPNRNTAPRPISAVVAHHTQAYRRTLSMVCHRCIHPPPEGGGFLAQLSKCGSKCRYSTHGFKVRQQGYLSAA